MSVEHLMEVTCCGQRELATRVLEATGGDIDLAVEIYFNNLEGQEEEKATASSAVVTSGTKAITEVDGGGIEPGYRLAAGKETAA